MLFIPLKTCTVGKRSVEFWPKKHLQNLFELGFVCYCFSSGSHFVCLIFWVYSFAYFFTLISLLLGVLATVDIQHTDCSLYVHINILYRYFDCTMIWNFVLVISKNRKIFLLYNDWEILWGYKKMMSSYQDCPLYIFLNVAGLNHSHFECSIIFTSNDCSWWSSYKKLFLKKT